MHRRRLLRVGGSALVLAGAAGCLGSGSGSSRRVSMAEGFVFSPERVQVAPGTTVRWVNDSEVGHTVTAYEGRIPERAGYFASGGFEDERGARNDVRGGLLDAGERYEHTFEVEGEYGYFCVPHESSGMTGTVVVG
jgi:plastocyanin